MRRWTKTAQPPVKSASRLCCSFLPKPTARQAEARARGPPCAGDACRLAVSDTGRCGAGLGLSAPRLMPFPLYLIASCTLSYPPSSAQMLPCLWNLSHSSRWNQSFSPRGEGIALLIYSSITEFRSLQLILELFILPLLLDYKLTESGDWVMTILAFLFYTLTIHVGCIKLILHPVRKTDILSILLITLTEV